mmetsp:Transcript_17032/g.31947  ORF Transcript_17032/g.31947 Transcript_17032/m.31947 type:complete len:87 (+) Transcript_17032:575-835(+)
MCACSFQQRVWRASLCMMLLPGPSQILLFQPKSKMTDFEVAGQVSQTSSDEFATCAGKKLCAASTPTLHYQHCHGPLQACVTLTRY